MANILKFLILCLVLLSCSKAPCIIKVPVTFTCENPKDLKSINVNFYQGDRPVMADIIHGYDFTNGKFSLTYYFSDTNPDRLVWIVYDQGWNPKVFETAIR